MAWLIALIPAIAWGSTGIFGAKMGGSAAQQTLGMTFGALVFGLVTMFAYVVPVAGVDFAFNPHILLVGFISGLFWAVGQAGQFVGFRYIGVSLGSPLSTTGQIVINAILAAAVLRDWTTAGMWIYGLVAIVLVVTGAVLTSLPDANAPKQMNPNFNFTKGFLAMLVSTVGYGSYFVFPNLMAKVGYVSAGVKETHDGLWYMTAVVGPQSIGQVLGAFIIAIFVMKEADKFGKATWKNILTGMVWAAGNVAMFISAGNPNVGQAAASTLSQMGIIVGVFGGIYILGEKKTARQMVFAVIGVILVALGGVLISMLGKTWLGINWF
jgi:glucose uptake protein